MGHQGQNYSCNVRWLRPRISKRSTSDSVDSAISSRGSITDLADTSRSTPSPTIQLPPSYMQMSPPLSPTTQNTFQSIYPRVLEVINGKQFRQEPAQTRAYSPFNDCNCTLLTVCDYCTSRYQCLKVSPNALTPYRPRSLSTSTGGTVSPPLQTQYPRYARFVCRHHPCAKYFFCQTCYITSCTVCELAEHTNHEIGNLEHAFETAENEARQIYSQMLISIEALNYERNELPVTANILEGKAKQTTDDVLSFVKLLIPGISGKQHWLLKKNQHKLLMEIQNIKTYQKSLIQSREGLLRNSIMILRNSAHRLYHALQASKTAANPLDLIMKKYMAMFDMEKVRESHENCHPIKNWMAFKVNSNVGQLISTLGKITLDNPGPIGDGRPVKGCNDASSSASPIRKKSLLPVPGGSAVSGYRTSVIIWTEWFRAPHCNIKIIGVTDHPSEKLCRPWGVACDRFGHIVVGDRSNNRIQIYGEDGTFIRMFGKQGRDLGEFDRPAGIAIDKHRRIIVADKDNHRIQIFTMEGKFLHTFGVHGHNYGEFVYPWDVAVNSECEIVVSDTRNNRIQMFSPQGVFLKSFGSLGQTKIFDVPRGVCFTPEGNVLVCDFNNHRVVKVNSDFTSFEITVRENDKIKPISRPQGIVADDKGNFVVVDSKKNRFQVRNKKGWFRREFGEHDDQIFQMINPAGVALTTSGKIVVVDFGHNRVLIF